MDIVGIYCSNLIMFLGSSNVKLSFNEKEREEMYEFGLNILVKMI
jgi:hypothetical protein